MLHRVLWALTLAHGLSAQRAGAQAPAQFVRGSVLDSVTGQPVAGSIVMAMGASGTVLVRTLANERGVYQVSLPGAATGIRVLHMGYRPRDVPVPRTSTGIIQMNVSMARVQTTLEVMNVRANGNCSPRKDRALAQVLYEQARDGLLATIVAREAANIQMKRLRFDRTLNRNRGGIASQEVFIDTVVAQATPFAAVRTAQQFVERGFVGDSAGSALFFAPDAETIIEEAFRSAYCFKIGDSDKKRPTQVALEFEKGKRNGRQVDIEGAIWLDTLRRNISRIEFRYVGLNSAEEAYKLGGFVQFREMTNGSVLIDEWTLKLLHSENVTQPGRRGLLVTVPRIDVHETGGALVSARWPDGTSWRAPLGTLLVQASTRDGKPAAGARVALAGTNYSALTDDTGEAEVAELMPGPYRVEVLDSTLAILGITLPTSLRFEAERDSVFRATIVAPTNLDYAEQRCKSEPQGGVIKRSGAAGGPQQVGRTAGSGVSLFVYVTGIDNAPLANVPITEDLQRDRVAAAYRSTDVISGKTDAGGRYFSCWNDQLGETVQIWIRQPGKAPQLTLKSLNNKVEAVRIVAGVQTVAAATNAAKIDLAGIVFDSLSNRPLSNAIIQVSGLDVTTSTDAAGAFKLPAIDAGFYTILARHPKLDTLGIGELGADLDLSASKSDISLGIPSFARLWGNSCTRTPPRDSGFIYGIVRESGTREVLPDTRVRVLWTDVAVGADKKILQTKRTAEAKTNQFGEYAVCGIPVDVPLDIVAELDVKTQATLALSASASRVQHQDVTIDMPADSATTGRVGAIKGRITNAAGDGVSNVRVMVNDVVRARSDSVGAFMIQRVATGTRTVEFVAIGMSPISRIVEVMEGQTSDVSVKLERVTVLEKVEVTGTVKQHILDDLEDRKKLGFGYIQDSTIVGRAGALVTAMRGFPSVLPQYPPPRDKLRPQILFRKSIGLGELCEANYFVDRHRVDRDAFYNVPIPDIAWIEVYPRRFTVPREFMGGAECGVVALFTKFSVGK